ncbi:MAG: signal peptidase II [Actinomycetota bacterium]|nr:signal peptidase II [Actinomycetota bacterium]
MTSRLVPVAVAGVVVAFDQTTKTWALHHVAHPRHVVGTVWLALTFNSGAAFGLGQGVTPVIEGVVVALVTGLLIVGRQAARQATFPTAVGLGLLVGGAVGNLADRVVRHDHGSVIDFIAALRIGTHDRWPIFNVADAAIVVGAVILAAAYSARRPSDRDGEHRRPARTSTPDHRPT